MTEPFSATGLERLHDIMAKAVKTGTPPGLVLLIAKGDAVHVDAIGDKAIGGTPMQRDSIFRITSMTKPITAAAAMMLVEDGKLALDEPAERLLPELANRQVLTSLDAPLSSTVPAERPILVRDLMNFTLGFGLQFDQSLPIQNRIDELALVNGPPVPQTPHQPDEWMKRFGTLPLMHQPGATWNYNTGSLILGVLIARASGQPLGEFMKARIFEPLGMTDTAFFVPEAKRDRFVSAYNFNFQTGESFLEDKPDGQWSAPPPFPSGAAGLVSTVDDYLAFARMMLAKGTYQGKRLLSEASVAEMTRDQLTPAQEAGAGLGPGFFDKSGWGFGMRVQTQPDDTGATPGRYGWDGGFGSSWANDPNVGLIGILMTQSTGYYLSSNGFHDFWTAVYRSIEA